MIKPCRTGVRQGFSAGLFRFAQLREGVGVDAGGGQQPVYIHPFIRFMGSAAGVRAESHGAGQGAGTILGRFAAEWLDDAHAFELQRQPYLLYE